MIKAIKGNTDEILRFLQEAFDKGILEIDEIKEGLHINAKNNKEAVFQLKSEMEKQLDKAVKKYGDINQTVIASNQLKSGYNFIPFKDIRAKVLDLREEGKSYIDAKELIILAPKDAGVREKLIKILLNLTNGDLSVAKVGKINKGENYLYRIRKIEKKGYLHNLKSMESEMVFTYYKYKNFDSCFIQMGYSVKDTSFMPINFTRDKFVELRGNENLINIILKNYDVDDMTPLINTVSFNFELEKTTEVYAMEYDLKEHKDNVTVSLSLKKTGFKKEDNLEAAKQKFIEEANRIEQIQILKEDRETAKQIVVISYRNREKLGSLLSVLSSEVIKKIKIATVEVGESLDEKYFFLIVDGYHIKSKLPSKIYCMESSLSLHGIELYIDEDKYLFPLYAMRDEENEMSREDYHKLIFGKIENSNLDIEGLKKEKNLIAILDDSRDIFSAKDMIFIREKDISSNVIEVFNQKLIEHSEEFKKLETEYLSVRRKRREKIKSIEEDMQKNLESSVILLSQGMSIMKQEWNSTLKKMLETESAIKDRKNDKQERLDNLLNRMKEMEDVEAIKNLFESLYTGIVREAKKMIETQENFINREKELYAIWRNDWQDLKARTEGMDKDYQAQNNGFKNYYEKFKESSEKKFKESDQLLLEFQDSLNMVDKKLEELIKRYE